MSWGRRSCPQQALLGAKAVPHDTVGTDWPCDSWGCPHPCHGTCRAAVIPNLLWAPGVAVTPSLPRMLHVPPPPLSTPLHFAFTGPHPSPCPRAGVYLISSFIRCLSAKPTSISSCRAWLSPLYLSIQLTSRFLSYPQRTGQMICPLPPCRHILHSENRFHVLLQFFLHD